MRLPRWLRRRRPAPEPPPVYEYRLTCEHPERSMLFGWQRGFYPERTAAQYRLTEINFAEHGIDVRDAWWTCERREAAPWSALYTGP